MMAKKTLLRIKRMLSLAMIGFAITGAACSDSQPILELSPNENPAGLKDKATPPPTNIPEISSLPPSARPITVSDGVILGMAIRKVQPVYPLEAQAKGITGEIKIRVNIDQDGNVGEAIALNGHPLLQTAALAAVNQWRWRPTMIDTDRPIYVQGILTFHFPPHS